MADLLILASLLFLGSIAGLSGGILLLFKEDLARRYSTHLISFAAGVMIAAAFLDLLPEATKAQGEGAFSLALVGLVIFFMVEYFLLHFHHHEGHPHPLKSVVPLIVGGDFIHNFVDGIVISASFLADPKLGFFVALATFFHEVPQEIGDFAVLLDAGVDKLKVVYYNLFSALATFLGAGATFFLAARSNFLVGPLLGLATGMFLYIALSDILPGLVKGEKGDKWQIAVFFLVGIGVVYFLTNFLPE